MAPRSQSPEGLTLNSSCTVLLLLLLLLLCCCVLQIDNGEIEVPSA
jgi:hypothetical protein